MLKYKSKRIWLDTRKTYYSTIRIYDCNESMQKFYNGYNRYKGMKVDPVLGASLHYEKLNVTNDTSSPDIGIILLSRDNLTTDITHHEILHAVIWAWKFKPYKRQHPITIYSMKQEEELLHNFSFAIKQFNKINLPKK